LYFFDATQDGNKNIPQVARIRSFFMVNWVLLLLKTNKF
jgi:hypothetical protein